MPFSRINEAVRRSFDIYLSPFDLVLRLLVIDALAIGPNAYSLGRRRRSRLVNFKESIER